MKLLRLGSKGKSVRKWQFFLTGQGLYDSHVNGVFDKNTKLATMAFQESQDLDPDGIVGETTISAAIITGFLLADWPPKPSFLPLVGNEALGGVFGTFSYVASPTRDNPERIIVTDNWVKENIVRVNIPQLASVTNGSTNVLFHKKAKYQLEKLWHDWKKAGLIHLVKTWHGSYAARFRRDQPGILSNHAFGSAFDINSEWNEFREIPALVGQIGCVRELVEIANDNGFYWGGHFPVDFLDGMHFEVAVLKKPKKKKSKKKKPHKFKKKKKRFKQNPAQK